MGCQVLCLILLTTISLVVFTQGMERSAFYEGTADFAGLSRDAGDISKRQCAMRYRFSLCGSSTTDVQFLTSKISQICSHFSDRCLISTCRGIYFDGGGCKNLYETNDVPESDRNQYNPVSFTSNEDNLLINGKHFTVLHVVKCGSIFPLTHHENLFGLCPVFHRCSPQRAMPSWRSL